MLERNTRMFREVTTTYNPIVGCYHNCEYCWARRIAKRVGRKIKCPYCYNFIPHTHFSRRLVAKNRIVFVCDMGDLFGKWVDDIEIGTVFHLCRQSENTYYFLTKNPSRYCLLGLGTKDTRFRLPKLSYLGATIETDIDDFSFQVSKAPPVSDRITAMQNLAYENKFVSIEPILQFNLERFVRAIKRIKPKFVYIGYDNYNHQLPEPPIEDFDKLVEELDKFTEVRIKTRRRAWYE